MDASLKDKLKCLIFIPIISRTYYDPKSFAWEHEFKAFVEQASQDQFGLKVKLPNGNVASRVLPVRIHDLDTDDMKLFEGVTGSVMRTLDFVFKTTSGVNRSLKAKEDHPNDNLYKTYYQDQINKVSLAIREIISAIRQYGQKHQEVSKEISKAISVPREKNKTKIIVGSVIVLALIILGYFLIPKHTKPKEQVDKSLRINPNSSEAFVGKGQIYSDDDLVNSIYNLLKAASLNHGLRLPSILRSISLEYSSAGFSDKAKYYNLEALKLDGDSALYLNYLALSEKYQGNCEKAIEFLNTGYSIDTTQSFTASQLGMCYMFLNKFKESLKYYKKYIEILEVLIKMKLN